MDDYRILVHQMSKNMNEEMLIILGHKGNANQKDIEIPSHSSQNGHNGEHNQQMVARMQGEGNFYTPLEGM
jgi:hypothetical protein